MLPKSFSDAPVVFRADPVTEQHIEQFGEATDAQYYEGMPLTYPTVLRASEFEWLERLEIDMRELLHTDQVYEYISPLQGGDVPTVYTRIKDCRERRGMRFVELESEIKCGERLAIIARSSFVVRTHTQDKPR